MLSSMRVTFSVAGEAAAAGVGNIAVVFAGNLAFSRAAPATARRRASSLPTWIYCQRSTLLSYYRTKTSLGANRSDR